MGLNGKLNASTYLLFATFVLSVIVLIVAVKYTNWAYPQTESDMQTALIFYNGSTPVVSLVQSVLHMAVLHFEAILPTSFTIFIAGLQTLGWFATAGLWTHCENAYIPTPGLCPQRVMIDLGKNGLVGIGLFKESLAWVTGLVYLAMLVLATKPLWSPKEESYDDDGAAQPVVHLPPKKYWRARSQVLPLADYETRVA